MPVLSQAQAQASISEGHALSVHRCRFVDYNPAAVTAITFPPLALPGSRFKRGRSKRRFGDLAVGRANGNIELYEWAIAEHVQDHVLQAPQAWVLVKILHGPPSSKVDSLVLTLRHPHLLAHDEVPALDDLRLFSSGGGSEVLEWDIGAGSVKRNLNSQGGVIWSMAPNPSNTTLALGCEDGSVRLVDIASDEFMQLRRFDRIKCRILSLAWGPPVPPNRKEAKGASDESSDDEEDKWTDSWLVTGGSDSSLRRWDVKTGRITDKMSTDKVRGERTLVWAVAVLPDGTIVSGDSLGTVKFWDGQMCTQLHSFSAHGADVLCVAIGPDGNSVFTSGVDQKTCLFTRVKLENSDADQPSKLSSRAFSQWVHSGSKRMHSHDVRSLAIWPPPSPHARRSSSTVPPGPFAGVSPILASGGLDASLVLAPCAVAGLSSSNLINPLATSTVSTFEDAYHRRLAYPTGTVSSVLLAQSARLIVHTQEAALSIWRIVGRASIPSALEADLQAADAMDVDSQDVEYNPGYHQNGNKPYYEKLLEMELDVTTNLCASAVSDNGRWLAVSDAYEIKLFGLFQNDDGSLRPKRIKSFMSTLLLHLAHEKVVLSDDPEGASILGFTPDSGKLVVATRRSARIILVDLSRQTQEGTTEIHILRMFDQHVKRTTSILKGRVLKSLPGQSNGHNNPEGRDSEDGDGDDDTDKIREVEGQSDNESDAGEFEQVTVTRMALSPDGQWLATTDTAYRTHIFNLDSVQHHTLLPTSPAPVTALAFSPSPTSSVFSASVSTLSSSSDTLLILSHSDATIGVFDVEARKYAPWASHLSQRSELPRRWTALHDGVLGIEIEPSAQPSSISSPQANESCRHALFWGSTWLCRVTLDAPAGWGDFLKKRRRDASPAKPKQKQKPISKQGSNADQLLSGVDHDGEGNPDEESPTNFKLVMRYRPILRAGFLSSGELVVVERPLVDVLRMLPPAFFKPRYGS